MGDAGFDLEILALGPFLQQPPLCDAIQRVLRVRVDLEVMEDGSRDFGFLLRPNAHSSNLSVQPRCERQPAKSTRDAKAERVEKLGILRLDQCEVGLLCRTLRGGEVYFAQRCKGAKRTKLRFVSLRPGAFAGEKRSRRERKFVAL